MPVRIVARRSSIHGQGVFARTRIPAGALILVYKGRLITHAQADRRYGDSTESGHTFLFTLNARYIIDANADGNAARWINHSCVPNCRACVVENRDGDPRRDRVQIEALRDITPGEELTYNYGIVLESRQTPRLKRLWACRCGSVACTSTMLQPKRTRTALA
ncbi:MAG: SET domain-containing protein-lysine N-methyltransferase [Xanthomonadaceae bacterium]|nr:SET domain-containing protein-lysine N-methyltransferase [Xanthomonadaceae bacterium]MDE2177262.1 SET domain-containing protein-lysine N-methyltransferase [Xanthomonadaceae bacterium]MDE2245688.1 SET domain-containing protein-lysine N-methyltransferase [Xanthomonadaceae bacterium]